MQDNQIEEAKKYFARCLRITDRMMTATFSLLKTRCIEFMVAPYEADCQIAKLKL